MPFVHITTAKKLDDSTKNKLHEEIIKIMPVLPGKDKDNTLLCIDDGAGMYRGGEPNDGIFAEVRLYKKSPEDAKKEFSQKIHAIFKDVLKIPDNSCVYLNFMEFENWSSNGNYS